MQTISAGEMLRFIRNIRDKYKLMVFSLCYLSAICFDDNGYNDSPQIPKACASVLYSNSTEELSVASSVSFSRRERRDERKRADCGGEKSPCRRVR